VAGQRVGGYFSAEREDRFIEELFSFSGKWKALTRGDASYERFVRKAFERHLFHPAEFDLVLEQIRRDYAYGVAAAENRLLVALYGEIRPEHPELAFDDFRKEYGRLSSTLAPHVFQDLGMNLVAFAGSEVASVLLVGALSSAGILGGSAAGGAVGGPWTFGISLVVGVAVGLALDAGVGAAYEDAARMEVRRAVNNLRNRIIDDVHDALARALTEYRNFQERCVEAMFEGGSRERLAARP
jgi:hypothetical protein